MPDRRCVGREVAGTAQERLPLRRVVTARAACRADRQREVVHRLPHRDRIGRRPALRGHVVPHAKPLLVEGCLRQEVERPLHHGAHLVGPDPDRPEMLEEIARRGRLSAPPHHDGPTRLGIHVEAGDRPFVDPARARHKVLRSQYLVVRRQPLAREGGVERQRPMHGRWKAAPRAGAGSIASRNSFSITVPGRTVRYGSAAAGSPSGAPCRPPRNRCNRSAPTAAAVRAAHPSAAPRATTSDPHSAHRPAGRAS